MDLARTMANEAAINLGNAQLYVTARALADRDPLTGFFNHRYLHERLGEEILRAQRANEPVSLLMLDLDDFKLVNDTLGHLFGDEVLKWAAGQIRAVLRASDVPTRYGGDEFAMILPGTTGDEARAVGDRIVHALAAHAYRASGHGPVPVTASIGTASFPEQGRTPRELIAVADGALYRVKDRGGAAVDRATPRVPGTAGAERPHRPATRTRPSPTRSESRSAQGSRVVRGGPAAPRTKVLPASPHKYCTAGWQARRRRAILMRS